MRRLHAGRMGLGVWLTLCKSGQPSPPHVLFLADRGDRRSFQAWLRDLRGYPHPPQHVVPSERGAVAPRLSAVEGQGSPLRARYRLVCGLSARRNGQWWWLWGDEAARATIRACPLPTLIVGLTRRQVAPLLAGRRGAIPSRRSTSKPIPSLNLRLARALLPAARTVGVLVPRGPGRRGWPSAAGRGPTLALHAGRNRATDDLDAVRALRPRLPGLDAVLLPPEPDARQRMVVEAAVADDRAPRGARPSAD
jgi:hypothetical protein